MNYYMHTLDGAPAQFEPGIRSLVYCGKTCTRLATSLDQIRTEQRIDRRTELERRRFASDLSDYSTGYIRIPIKTVLFANNPRKGK